MKNDRKYKQLNRRAKGYTSCSIGSIFIGLWADTHNYNNLSNLMTVVGATTSVASIINFIRSLEYYDIDDADLFFLKHKMEMEIMPILDSLSLAFSMMSREKKKSIVKAIENKIVRW